MDDDFIGPHTIHGIQTFFFINRWLRPERSAKRAYGCDDHAYCYKTVASDFHGYSLSSPKTSSSYVTQLLDSNRESVIRGKFYVSDTSTLFTGMAFKLARVSNPGDLIVRFGSHAGTGDIGGARVLAECWNLETEEMRGAAVVVNRYGKGRTIYSSGSLEANLSL